MSVDYAVSWEKGEGPTSHCGSLLIREYCLEALFEDKNCKIFEYMHADGEDFFHYDAKDIIKEVDKALKIVAAADNGMFEYDRALLIEELKDLMKALAAADDKQVKVCLYAG